MATETRPCELRVMNSANALYVALKVPDQTVDNSLSPLMLDAAILGFCQGDQVRARDDRKVIAQGIYRDKFVDAPGKGDGDDAHQDGRGAMTREKGMCSFEWAVPLDSGDKDDLRAKPGDSFRFNLAYFDALQLPMTKTRMGGVYGVHLDKADGWGTLRLAANVKDDGGTAFQSPAWVKALAERLKSITPSRLRVTETTLVPGSSPSDRQGARLVHLPGPSRQGERGQGQAVPARIDPGNGKHQAPAVLRRGIRAAGRRRAGLPDSEAGSSSRRASSRPTP